MTNVTPSPLDHRRAGNHRVRTHRSILLKNIRRIAAVAVATLVMGVLATPPSTAAPSAATTRYIVTLDGAVGDVAGVALDLLDQLGAGQLVDTYEHALNGFVVDLPSALAPVLGALPGVT